jgi:hypothetical protein
MDGPWLGEPTPMRMEKTDAEQGQFPFSVHRVPPTLLISDQGTIGSPHDLLSKLHWYQGRKVSVGRLKKLSSEI